MCIRDSYSGDKGVRTLSCAEQFRVMAFAQLTYRESLRDIETCLSAQSAKLYHMGFREPVRRATLADANESRDWRIYADFAAWLIVQARKLYASEEMCIRGRLDADKFRTQVTLAGYAHVTQVVSPGEYSIRGGLIDLFPMGSQLPYRCLLYTSRCV